LEIENRRFQQPGSVKADYCSAGLHPWFLAQETLNDACDWLREQAQSPNTIAIGEAGLDKLTATPWALQLAAFQHCIEISETLQKPLIIHCVRAFNEIIALKKALKPQQPWIFHGFNKNCQTAELLLAEGCYLSFGKAIFQENNHAAAVLAQVPANRFFLETDDAAELDIEAVYEKAVALRRLPLQDLQQLLEARFREVFLIKM
jgi:TatD DNase family protein